jgi:hypothetical protein
MLLKIHGRLSQGAEIGILEVVSGRVGHEDLKSEVLSKGTYKLSFPCHVLVSIL